MSDQEKIMPTEAENQAQQPQQPEEQEFEMDGGQEAPDESQEQKSDEPETEDPPQTDKAEKPERPINQQAVDKRINKAIREKYEEKRKREKIEHELQQARQKLEQYDKKIVDIPDMPDAFDPNFDEKIKQRDEALKEQARIEAKKVIEQEHLENQMRQQAQKDRDTINGYVQNMFSNAQKIGINEDELRQADDTVAGFIKDAGLATFILSQNDAPLIIHHLANNLSELENISRMNPIEAAAYIATSVTSSAKKYRPNIPTTPDPLDIPQGKAKGTKQSEYLDGVEFE